MLSITEGSMNSNLSSVNSDDVEESEEDLNEKAGPSRSKTVIIKKVTPEEQVISYRKILTVESEFQDSIPFERCNFTCRKHSNEIGHAKNHLGEALSKHFDKLLGQPLSKVLSSEMTDELSSFLFVVSAYVAENYFGKPSPKSDNVSDLYQYVHRLLNINKNQEHAHFVLVNSIKPPQFLIKLFLLEASGLTSMDISRDLYCRAWISSDSKVGGMTSTAQGTELPAWYFKFIFRIKNFKNDVITIEMRDFSGGNKTDLSCVFGKCKKQMGELIGTADIRVSDIYSEGIDEWIPLDCSRSEFENIALHIRVKFGIVPPKMRLSGLKAHLLLLKSCVEESMKDSRDRKDIMHWKNLLNNCALTLIFLHGVISCISESEDIICRFVVIVHLGIKMESFSYKFLYYLLLETVKHLKDRKPCCDFVDSNLELMYEKEVQNLNDYCSKLISSLHDHNIVFRKRELSEFEFAFKTLHLCQNIGSTSDVASVTMLKSEAEVWSETKAKTIMALTSDNRVSYLIEFLDYLLRYQQTVDNTFRKEFPGETYTEMVYKTLQDKLLEPLRYQIEEFSRHFLEDADVNLDGDKTSEEGIEMFSKMRQLVIYISTTVDVPATDLTVGSFQKWFGDPVFQKWYQYRQVKAEKEIENSVVHDKLWPLDDSSSSEKCSKESISARETCQIIEKRIKGLWLLISVPRSRKYDEMFLSGFYRCCSLYSVLVNDTLSNRKYFEDFRNEGRTHLCVSANNLWFVANYAEQTISDAIDYTLPDHSNVSTTLQTICRQLCSCMADRYFTVIEAILGKVLRDEQADVNEYSDYIQKIVWQEIHTVSSLDVFVIFLKALTKRITGLLSEYFVQAERQEAEEGYSSEENDLILLLIKVLTITKDTCTIPGEGDKNAEIWDAASSKLSSDLKNKAQSDADDRCRLS